LYILPTSRISFVMFETTVNVNGLAIELKGLTNGSTVYTPNVFTNKAFTAEILTEPIQAVGHHTYGEVDYEWNENTLTCKATKTCTKCTEGDAYIVSETVAGTKLINKSTAADCVNKGANVYAVDFSKEGFEDKEYAVEIDALKHELSAVEYTWPETTDENGETIISCKAEYACTRDNCDYSASETVAVTVNVTVAPKCETTGLAIYQSAEFTNPDFDAQTKENVELPKLEHDMVSDNRVEPGCFTDGYESGAHCTRCDYVTGHTVIPAAHKYGNPVTKTPATCEGNGEQIYTCSVCGTEAVNVKKAQVITETGEDPNASMYHVTTGDKVHLYKEVVNSKNVLVDTIGVAYQTCVFCNEIVWQEAHSLQLVFGAWNCSNCAADVEAIDGSNSGFEWCSVYGHYEDVPVTTKEPTCMETGLETVHCILCNHELSSNGICNILIITTTYSRSS